MLMLGTHTVHIAGRGSVVRQLRIGFRPISASLQFSHRSSVSFGQERSSKSAPTTCTNRQRQAKITHVAHFDEHF